MFEYGILKPNTGYRTEDACPLKFGGGGDGLDAAVKHIIKRGEPFKMTDTELPEYAVGNTPPKKIRLEDVAGPELLAKYYAQEGLVETDEKIERLLKLTGVIAYRADPPQFKPEWLLSLLEESVYDGRWTAFSDRKDACRDIGS